MLLTIHNLPIKFRYVDVKNLLAQKCGLSELILDNLSIEGSTKKVTVGVSDDGDAAILVRKINGLYVEGQQLYVEDVRKKRMGSEQPFRSEKVYLPPKPSQHYVPDVPVALQTHVQTQYADSQAYISQNTIMQTNAIAVAPYMMGGQPAMMPAYGMYMGTQDAPMLALPNPQDRQQDKTPTYWNQQAQQWARSANANPWGEPTSETRRSRWDRSERDRYSEERGNNSVSQREPGLANFQGNPDYLARHAPPELLNKYQDDLGPPRPEWQKSYQDSQPDNRFQENTGSSFGNRDGPLFGNRDDPPFGNRDGPPFGNRDSPPFANRDGPPFGNRDGPPFGNRDGPPFGNRDDPPFGNRDGPRIGNHVPISGDRNGQRFEGNLRNFSKFDSAAPFTQKRKRAAEWTEKQFPKKFKEGSFNAGPELKGPTLCPSYTTTTTTGLTIPQKDRTWRGQAASQIAKSLAGNEPQQVLKYYKRAVVNRLDKLLGDRIGVPIAQMISRYKARYNDTNVLNACRRSYEEDVKAMAQKTTTPKVVGPPSVKPTSKGPVIEKGTALSKGPVAEKGAQAPVISSAGQDGNVIKKKGKTANIVVPGRTPNYPAGDKKIFQDAKTQMKKEFTGEVTYSLDEPIEQALQADLEPLNAILKDNCGTSDEEADPADNYVAERADSITDELMKDDETETVQRRLASQPPLSQSPNVQPQVCKPQPLVTLESRTQPEVVDDVLNIKQNILALRWAKFQAKIKSEQTQTVQIEKNKPPNKLTSDQTEGELSEKTKPKRVRKKRRTGLKRMGGHKRPWGRLPKRKKIPKNGPDAGLEGELKQEIKALEDKLKENDNTTVQGIKLIKADPDGNENNTFENIELIKPDPDLNNDEDTQTTTGRALNTHGDQIQLNNKTFEGVNLEEMVPSSQQTRYITGNAGSLKNQLQQLTTQLELSENLPKQGQSDENTQEAVSIKENVNPESDGIVNPENKPPIVITIEIVGKPTDEVKRKRVRKTKRKRTRKRRKNANMEEKLHETNLENENKQDNILNKEETLVIDNKDCESVVKQESLEKPSTDSLTTDQESSTIKLHLTKRILSVTANLSLRIAPYPLNIRKDVLSAYLRQHGVVSLRRGVKAQCYLATVDSYDNYDKLVAMKTATVAEGQTIKIETLRLVAKAFRRSTGAVIGTMKLVTDDTETDQDNFTEDDYPCNFIEDDEDNPDDDDLEAENGTEKFENVDSSTENRDQDGSQEYEEENQTSEYEDHQDQDENGDEVEIVEDESGEIVEVDDEDGEAEEVENNGKEVENDVVEVENGGEEVENEAEEVENEGEEVENEDHGQNVDETQQDEELEFDEDGFDLINPDEDDLSDY